MPYQPGAVVHGVTHIADVYKSGNVYANNVKVALWLPPGVSEAFAFDPVAPVSTSYEVSEAAPAIAEAATLTTPVVVPRNFYRTKRHRNWLPRNSCYRSDNINWYHHHGCVD